MPCANMQFKHNGPCGQSDDLSVFTPGLPNPFGFRAGVISSITIQVWNGSVFSANGSIVLYWAQVVPDGAGGYQFIVQTEYPIAASCFPQTVPPFGSQLFQVTWMPEPDVVGSAEMPQTIALFAQAVATADPAHGCPFGAAHPADYDFTSVYNAAKLFPLV